MRILMINPNTTESMTKAIDEAARAVAGPDTEIVTVQPRRGPRSIEGHLEEATAAVATLELMVERRTGYDAYVIACAGDPGLAAARELVDAPVIGIAEAAMHMACLVAHRFSIISVVDRIKPMLTDMVQVAGMAPRCASVRTTGLGVLEIEEDWDEALRRLTEQGRLAITEDGAEAIVLGCAGMGPLDRQLRAELNVPVLDGCACAVTLAEACHRYGITTSKASAYRAPEPKEYLDWPVFDSLAR
ncbi:aspartate/glutamate racemase family protein [Pseudonocardia acaciae]|uniref:aspartate/glutamate racemase family protein n=1 Tax=Pseudonocardia acaciae TaxID=551276 RepID=UPI000491B692